mgnify:CR=1 FL=1
MDPLVGRKILRFDAVESTNDTAKELLGGDADEGTVIVAERQVAGKGRHGRAWFTAGSAVDPRLMHITQPPMLPHHPPMMP